MISLENAKRLRELGLGDEIGCVWYGRKDEKIYIGYYREGLQKWFGRDEAFMDEVIPMPTLSQLLEEVGKRGYSWRAGGPQLSPISGELHQFYSAHIWPNTMCWRNVQEQHEEELHSGFGPTPEDAVALALIEILKEER